MAPSPQCIAVSGPHQLSLSALEARVASAKSARDRAETRLADAGSTLETRVDGASKLAALRDTVEKENDVMRDATDAMSNCAAKWRGESRDLWGKRVFSVLSEVSGAEIWSGGPNARGRTSDSFCGTMSTRNADNEDGDGDTAALQREAQAQDVLQAGICRLREENRRLTHAARSGTLRAGSAAARLEAARKHLLSGARMVRHLEQGNSELQRKIDVRVAYQRRLELKLASLSRLKRGPERMVDLDALSLRGAARQQRLKAEARLAGVAPAPEALQAPRPRGRPGQNRAGDARSVAAYDCTPSSSMSWLGACSSTVKSSTDSPRSTERNPLGSTDFQELESFTREFEASLFQVAPALAWPE